MRLIKPKPPSAKLIHTATLKYSDSALDSCGSDVQRYKQCNIYGADGDEKVHQIATGFDKFSQFMRQIHVGH
jgi:hypothetical protein